MMLYNKDKISAFTLVELAIVLIIIGLITGGVVGAQSLIESSKVQAEIKNIERMRTAVQAFILEFDHIPGDMPDAYDYFGNTCGNDNDHNQYGCNGDGDKCISAAQGIACLTGGSGITGDIWKFNEHLVLSGIYPDLPYMAGYSPPCISGEHIAQTSIGSGIYFAHSMTPNKIYLRFIDSRITSVCTTNSWAGYITPKNAKKIDEKTDDGNGVTGLYQARYALSGVNDGLLEGTDCMDSDGNYAVSETGTNCAIRVEVY